MATQRSDAPCPVCDGAVNGWAFACPRCGYHPDRYNRTLDDVALIFRLSSAAGDRPVPQNPRRVRSFFNRMIGRDTHAGDAPSGLGPLQPTQPPPESSPGAGAVH